MSVPLSPTTEVARRVIRTRRATADRAFRVMLVAAASTVLVVLAGILIFLASQAGPAWHHGGIALLTRDNWAPRSLHPTFGFLGPMVGSVLIALIALTFAVPVAVATSMAINEYLPRSLRRPLTGLIDLLAALPSLIYGLWGKFFLDAHLYRTSVWLGGHADFFPLFRVAGPNYNGSIFLAGIIVAIMILPLVTAISREVMSQVPREDCEAALALGGTRWGMMTTVVLPFSRNGIVGGAMLGLGRALGETIAVSLVLLADQHVTAHILQPGGGSVSALIVNEFLGASRLEQSALTIAGLTLFSVTLAINIGARSIVARAGRGATT